MPVGGRRSNTSVSSAAAMLDGDNCSTIQFTNDSETSLYLMALELNYSK
jgi:hypothetical protein